MTSASLYLIRRAMHPDTVTQPFRRGHPKIVSLKVDPEHIVMRRRTLHRNSLHHARAVSNQHLWLMRIKRRAIDRPVHAIVVSQPFISRKPGTIGVNRLHLV